ncbi:hypothetical protein GGX14DRAFT_399670 [Mycena pura]|uniref:Uncharacterized protein n=1 Tax=Mycena pura TaxID=153505 RepID=A0AAD6VB56_9AGAR|nr:hypothetical protein GGX14DRAFT_399670 [Mycena pura]
MGIFDMDPKLNQQRPLLRILPLPAGADQDSDAEHCGARAQIRRRGFVDGEAPRVPAGTLSCEVCDASYASVPGAALAQNSSLRNEHLTPPAACGLRRAPRPLASAPSSESGHGPPHCSDGQPYPLHMLDVTVMYTETGPDGKTYVHHLLRGAITNGGSITSGHTGALSATRPCATSTPCVRMTANL